MSDKRPYSTPEVVNVGSAAELTEGYGGIVADWTGAGIYHDASKGMPPDTSEQVADEGEETPPST